jgi:hypothetical protein
VLQQEVLRSAAGEWSWSRISAKDTDIAEDAIFDPCRFTDSHGLHSSLGPRISRWSITRNPARKMRPAARTRTRVLGMRSEAEVLPQTRPTLRAVSSDRSDSNSPRRTPPGRTSQVGKDAACRPGWNSHLTGADLPPILPTQYSDCANGLSPDVRRRSGMKEFEDSRLTPSATNISPPSTARLYFFAALIGALRVFNRLNSRSFCIRTQGLQ